MTAAEIRKLLESGAACKAKDGKLVVKIPKPVRRPQPVEAPKVRQVIPQLPPPTILPELQRPAPRAQRTKPTVRPIVISGRRRVSRRRPMPFASPAVWALGAAAVVLMALLAG